MKTVAVIQARMSSTRLPGKVSADIAGKPMLWYVVTRARQARTLNQVVVATSDQSADDVIAGICAESAVECFRGDEEDVLDRYYQAATRYETGVIVRLTADCPLLDPEVIDKTVQTFQEGEFDYVSNTLDRTYPDGLDTEVFSYGALARAWFESSLKSEREHVTPYIWKHPQFFRLGSVKHVTDLSSMRWTVDEPADLEFVRKIYETWGPTPFNMEQLVDYLTVHPELSRVNSRYTPNAGYQRSLREDARVHSSGDK